jgi:acyl-CoA thioester hydrolase
MAGDSRVAIVKRFGFATEVSVRFAETDAQGVVHHAVYLVWFEQTRIDYLARFDGGYPALQAQGIEALTLETYVKHILPARFPDRVRISCRCLDLRGARFKYEYTVERGDELLAEGWTTHACVDAETFRPTRVPEWLTEAIVKAEERAPSS